LLGQLRRYKHSQGFIDMLATKGFALPNRSPEILQRAMVNIASKIVLDFRISRAVQLLSLPQFRMF